MATKKATRKVTRATVGPADNVRSKRFEHVRDAAELLATTIDTFSEFVTDLIGESVPNAEELVSTQAMRDASSMAMVWRNCPGYLAEQRRVLAAAYEQIRTVLVE